MEIELPKIKIEVTNRELFLLRYCVSELLTITTKLDLKRGFAMQTRSEVARIEEKLTGAIQKKLGQS